MAIATKFADGAPCWVDIASSDLAVTRAFYPAVFGWEAGSGDEAFGGYFQFFHAGAPVAGVGPTHEQEAAPDAWSVYLHVSDVAATLEKTRQHGGAVIVDALQVGELGTMAVVVDPSGATIGMWEPIDFDGLSSVGQPRTPVWFELHTNDFNRAVAFYRDVFSWTTESMSDVDEFRYTVVQGPADGVAGVFDATASLGERSSHWVVYFGVNDVDETLSAVTRAGGTVVSGAENTPYGIMATVADPSGAQFRVMANGSKE